MEERLQRALDECPEGGTFHLPTGEFEGPFVLRRRINLTGDRTTLWSRKGPVLTVEAAGVNLSGLSLEVTRPGNGEWDSVCLASRDRAIGLENVRINGAASGLGEEDMGFLLPQVLDLGDFPAGRNCRFWFSVSVPAAARLESRIEGLSVSPAQLAPGMNRVEVQLGPVADGVLIYGEVTVETRLIRPILVGGRCVPSAAGYQDGKELCDAAGVSATVEPPVVRGEGWRGGNIAPPVRSQIPDTPPPVASRPAPAPPPGQPPVAPSGLGAGRIDLTRNRTPKNQRPSRMQGGQAAAAPAPQCGGAAGAAAAQAGPQPFRDAAGRINLTRRRIPKEQRTSRMQSLELPDAGRSADGQPPRAPAASAQNAVCEGPRPLPAGRRGALVPGQKVPLGPAFEEGISLRLGWDGMDGTMNLELLLFLLGQDRKAAGQHCLMSRANPRRADGTISLEPDGSAVLRLREIPQEVQRIAVAVSASGGNGARCSAARSLCLGADPAGGGEGYRFEPPGLREESAIVLAEIYRRSGEWRLGAVGAGFSGGIAALCRSYGLDPPPEAQKPNE